MSDTTPKICCICNQEINSGKVFQIEETKICHEDCLKCIFCKEKIGPDQNYVSKNKDEPWMEPICKACFETNLKNCKKCGEKITKECVEAGEFAYHPDCFTCADCVELLKLKSEFYLNAENEALCEKCYLDGLPKCFKCKAKIKGGKSIKAFDAEFCPECFVCTSCKKVLEGVYQADRSNPLNIRPYCDECYKLKFSKNCKRCDKKVEDGEFISVNDAKFLYHQDCFVCFEENCDVKLSGEGELNVKRVIGCVEHVCKKCAIRR